MKTTLTRAATAAVMTLSLVCAGLARGDEAAPMQKEKDFKGTVTAVDRNEGSVSVKAFWSTRTFNLADNCKVSLEDKPEASPADIHPGQTVNVRYQDAHGVLVADQIAQHDVVFKGYITTVDPTNRLLTVKHGLFTRKFVIADNCGVSINNGKPGELNDLKVGQTIAVIYEPQGGALMAQKIERNNPTFVGTIQAIDSGTRTVKATSLLSEKTFHLADGCKIVTNGRTDGHLSDLRIGERVAFNYDDASGVLVANRIGADVNAPATENAQVSMSSPTPH